MSYFEKITHKAYDIEATIPQNGKFKYYIHCQSRNPDDYNVGFSLESKQLEDFINSMKLLKEKFIEWGETAKQNNVIDFEKKFDIKFKTVDTFFKYGTKWCFDKTKLAPYFRVTKEGEYIAVFSIGRMTASSNEFMHHPGFAMAFISTEEIDEFISALDPSIVLEKGTNNSVTDELFK